MSLPNEYEESLQRIWDISQAKFSDSQMHIDDYFLRLSLNEVHWIKQFMKDLLHVEYTYFCKHITLYSIIAVGTTTYPQEHWEGLEKYLNEKDPSKIEFAKRGGEDVDIQFIPEFKRELHNPQIPLEYKKLAQSDKEPSFEEIFKKRKEINSLSYIEFKNCSDADKYLWENYDFFQAIVGTLIETDSKYKIYPDESPFGANYWTVPKEFIEQEKQTVVRTKGKEYGRPTIHVEIPNGRKIHIYIDDISSAPEKIEREKSQNYCFSVIYRSGCHKQLEEAIKKREQAETKKI